MTQSGWRKPTSALGVADQLARDGEQKSIARTRCVVAAKRVGVHLGLKAADLLLLDILAAFTQPQDWEAGRRPIVWASNAFLMTQTGFSLSTLKRHARRLAEVGMIAFRDSPNGKRWGRRDAEGVIVEAYGFDLAPLSAQVDRFEGMAAELAEERALCQRLRRQITVARRHIRARLEAAGAGSALWTVFEGLLAQLPHGRAGSAALAALADRFAVLLDRVERAFFAVDLTVDVHEMQKNMNPREANSDPHIRITKQLHPVTCNSSEHEESSKGAPKPTTVDEVEGERNKTVSNRGKMTVDLPVILQACPEFATWGRTVGGSVRDWRDFMRVSEDLRPMIGVSEPAWRSAQAEMGKSAAAAALALVFEKVHAGEVTSPGGYLRGMVAKAGAGELHLERSFFGRLNGRAA